MEKSSISSYQSVYTAGYEGRNIQDFLKHLDAHNIQRVVDVREIPLSRKKGFSKNSLRQLLAESDIDYVHIKALGSPTHLRKKVYQDKDFDYFFEKYDEYLETCRKELEELYEIINEKLSCLLCFEKEHTNCHRSAVANRVSRIDGKFFEIKHI
ncbi:MAG: DUF488 domain-containing protein [Candidatus Omnitrophica bacterium]|nr:DUF488 domain-containing protein [Candidatus Omnitrophota bacterium]